MDEKEARELLGIAPDTPPRGWARGYLKAVRSPRSIPAARLHEAYEALLRTEVARSGKVTASADGPDRFTLHAPLAMALPVLRRVARRVGVIDWANDAGSELLLLVAGAPSPVEVRAAAREEFTSVRVVVPPAPDAARLLASDVVLRLVLGVNERARQHPGDGDETDVEEIVVGVFLETDDEDVFRDVAKHVEEMAAFLGDSRSMRVG